MSGIAGYARAESSGARGVDGVATISDSAFTGSTTSLRAKGGRSLECEDGARFGGHAQCAATRTGSAVYGRGAAGGLSIEGEGRRQLLGAPQANQVKSVARSSVV